jgi:CHAT domain-containing protein/tetratricopeptide (TPR) repeat protein
MKRFQTRNIVRLLVLLVSWQVSVGFSENISRLESLFNKNEFERADSVLKETYRIFASESQFDSLIPYLYYFGKVELELRGEKAARDKMDRLARKILEKVSEPRLLRNFYLELSSCYELIGDPEKGYDCNLEALNYTKRMTDATGQDYGYIYSNLGTLAKRKGKLSLALQHHRQALHSYESDPGSSRERIYITYNSLGGMMWFTSKIDSALYYYEKAEDVLKELEPTPMNRLYRPASLNNNIAAIYNIQGNTGKAMEAMEFTISCLSEFLGSEAPDSKLESGRVFYFQAIDNYAGLYKELGDFQKARDLLAFSFEEKKKHLPPDSPERFKGNILLGQIYLAMKNYALANVYLDAGIKHINRLDGNFYFWDGDAHYYKASIFDETGQPDSAAFHYEIAQQRYEEALQGAYDAIYLEFIIRTSYFYAQQGNAEKALDIAQETHAYIVENQGEKTLLEYFQILNLGEIHYILGNYRAALDKADEALAFIDDPIFKGETALDSIHASFQKPQAVLLRTKAKYQMKKDKNTVFLQAALNDLQNAVSLLERRKPYIGSDNNLSVLIANHSDVFEFAKKIALELYLTTRNERYLDTVMSLHESVLYNRIRSRLLEKKPVISSVPEHILDQERRLKDKMNRVLKTQQNIDSFLIVSDQWNTFLQTLKKNHPDYHALYYGSITTSYSEILDRLPPDKTIIRYFFVEDQLYVLLLHNRERYLYKLEDKGLEEQIAQSFQMTQPSEDGIQALYELYQKLWKPVEQHIQSNSIVVIPDGKLFNVSFESLTFDRLKDDLDSIGHKTLLARHAISYSYSLLLLQSKREPISFQDNFIAFVPEFNDAMKADYRIAFTDSADLDRTYLTLLPQPFSKEVARTAARIFNGRSFLNEQSTKPVFINQAREHKIIHIGTHAESNNIRPELSRIIFAKELEPDQPSRQNNSFYTFEIYDCNLSSNLTILTACETGKPTFQPGEGMISLAHAFNYAGSESILTSLWKIDEHSSATIVTGFYGYLADGLPKDRALQKAKLDYLRTAHGRTLTPGYWAGLILIGDTTPIDRLERASSNTVWYLAGFVVCIGIGVLIFIRRKGKSA